MRLRSSALPGLATAKRKARSLGGFLLRRVGLLPGGVPDRLGEDAAWRDRSLVGEVVLFFPDTLGGLYQLRTWYGPLRALHAEQGLTIVCMDSRTARAIRGEIDVPVLVISQESFLDELISRSNIKLFYYVNFTQMNFLALRVRSVLHISLLHGDSDKSVTVSNQVKAFDFSFVAGQAAVDRFTKYTSLFNAEERCVPIGRPQLDTDRRPMPRDLRAGEVATVLYAPTWEGGHDSVSYGSVASHGVEIVRSLIDEGFRVIYRPHPLTGQRLSAHGEADNEIRRLLSGKRDCRVSLGGPITEDFDAADLLVTDVSSVANDWLITRRPLIITSSAAAATREAATKLLEFTPRVTQENAHSVGTLARVEIDTDPRRPQRVELLDYYLGDTTPGASLERFLAASRRMAKLRDREWNRIKSLESASGSMPSGRTPE